MPCTSTVSTTIIQHGLIAYGALQLQFFIGYVDMHFLQGKKCPYTGLALSELRSRYSTIECVWVIVGENTTVE